MHRWDRLLDGYMEECEQRGLSQNCLYTRRLELERAGCWLKRRRPRVKLEDVGSEWLVRFIAARTRFLAKATICSVVTDLRGMGDYLLRRGVWTQNPMRWIRGPKLGNRHRSPQRITRRHMKALWEAAEKRSNEFRRYEMLCMLSLLYGTGLRRGEIARLTLDSWDREAGVLLIDGRKTGQERKVPVGEGVWRCMEAYLPRRHNYLEGRRLLDEMALFLNKDGEPISKESVSNRVHLLAKNANVPLVTVHQFRHTCASDLLENGVPLPQVQRVLGHAAIESTMRYTHIADPQRRDAILRHPLNEFLGAPEEGRVAV